MLREFSIIFVLSLTLNGSIGSIFEYPDVSQSDEDYNDSRQENSKKYMNAQSDYPDPIENLVADDEYPSEELERIVQEAREILKSDNEEEKRKLKIDPAFYHIYKSRKIVFEKKEKMTKKFRARTFDGSCTMITSVYRPKRLPDEDGAEHFILNIKDLEQEIITKKCAERGTSCGSAVQLPFGYETKCQQTYKEYPLFSIPVAESLSTENLIVNKFKLPTGCHCARERIELLKK